jgi:hypothetical protein
MGYQNARIDIEPQIIMSVQFAKSDYVFTWLTKSLSENPGCHSERIFLKRKSVPSLLLRIRVYKDTYSMIIEVFG